MFASHRQNENLPKWYGILSSALTFVAAAAVCFCIILVLIADASGAGKSLFGNTFLRVAGDSMSPFLVRGDVILCNDCDGGELAVGDVIVFEAPSGTYRGSLVTHRIYSITSDGTETEIRTKGDAANTPDSWTLTPDDVVAVYQKKLPFLTSVADFTSSTGGKATLIAVPVVLFFVVMCADAVLAAQLKKRAKSAVGNRDGKGDGEADCDKDV